MAGPVEAVLTLFPTARDGLRMPMPSGTPSLLSVFPSLEAEGEPTMIGAKIDAKNSDALEPGSTGVEVTLEFWADVGLILATPGTAFKIWYAGRIVGVGTVT
jgi:hypothetical protein